MTKRLREVLHHLEYSTMLLTNAYDQRVGDKRLQGILQTAAGAAGRLSSYLDDPPRLSEEAVSGPPIPASVQRQTDELLAKFMREVRP
jgi:hypothetical protein